MHQLYTFIYLFSFYFIIYYLFILLFICLFFTFIQRCIFLTKNHLFYICLYHISNLQCCLTAIFPFSVPPQIYTESHIWNSMAWQFGQFGKGKGKERVGEGRRRNCFNWFKSSQGKFYVFHSEELLKFFLSNCFNFVYIFNNLGYMGLKATVIQIQKIRVYLQALKRKTLIKNNIKRRQFFKKAGCLTLGNIKGNYLDILQYLTRAPLCNSYNDGTAFPGKGYIMYISQYILVRKFGNSSFREIPIKIVKSSQSESLLDVFRVQIFNFHSFSPFPSPSLPLCLSPSFLFYTRMCTHTHTILFYL